MSWRRGRAQRTADRLEQENIRRYQSSPRPRLVRVLAETVEQARRQADAVIRLEDALGREP